MDIQEYVLRKLTDDGYDIASLDAYVIDCIKDTIEFSEEYLSGPTIEDLKQYDNLMAYESWLLSQTEYPII